MTKTYIYKNLHKDTWSIMIRGTVRGHSDSVVIANAEFRVRPAGRAKVLREHRKNVHAFVVGSYISLAICEYRVQHPKHSTLWEPVQVSYNPYLRDTFYRKDTGAAVESAELVELRPDSSVWAWGLREGNNTNGL